MALFVWSYNAIDVKARFRSDALPELFEVLKKYVKPGKNYVLEISQEITSNQMKYYYSVVIPLFCEVTGYSKKKAHRILTEGFIDGRSITELSTIEMERFIEDCRHWMYHEFGTRPPEPGYYDKELMIELDKVFLY